MKVQRKKQKSDQDRKKALAETFSLAPTKTVLYGLTPEMLTYQGYLLVYVPSLRTYILIKPSAVDYRTPRYYKSDVYMLRDCLIDLAGAGDFDTYSHPVIECYDMDRIKSESRKNVMRQLSEKLSKRLEKNGYCLLGNTPLGVLLVKKVTPEEAEG